MALADMLPSFDDAMLLNLRSNAVRLATRADPRSEEAAALLPLIEAEIAGRTTKAPAKVFRRTSRNSKKPENA